MKVSVVIPVYNAAAYLDDALRSVFAQKRVLLEVIAVDDGSTDGSVPILDRWTAGRPNLKVVHQPNAGQGAARNRGLELATGEYVYFMDADDELSCSDALSRLVEAAEHDRLDALFFDAETRADPGVVIDERTVRASYYIRKHDYSAVRSGAELLVDMDGNGEFCVSPCLLIARRSFLEKNGLRFPDARIFYEDNIFMTHVMLAGLRMAHRPWRLYLRRVHAGSTVTSLPSVRHLRGYLACIRDVAELLSSVGLSTGVRKALLDRLGVYRHYARRVLKENPALLNDLSDFGSDDAATLKALEDYPLSEKLATVRRCWKDRGTLYTLKRIIARYGVAKFTT